LSLPSSRRPRVLKEGGGKEPGRGEKRKRGQGVERAELQRGAHTDGLEGGRGDTPTLKKGNQSSRLGMGGRLRGGGDRSRKHGGGEGRDVKAQTRGRHPSQRAGTGGESPAKKKPKPNLGGRILYYLEKGRAGQGTTSRKPEKFRTLRNAMGAGSRSGYGRR